MESMLAPRSLLDAEAVARRFGATVALDGVSMALRAGEVHALIGENGAGKSTLMKVLSGVLKPHRGTMHVDGHVYEPSSPLDARRAGIALIHQELSLCPHLSVAENVLLGVELSTLGWVDLGASRSRTAALLAQFGREDIDPDGRVADLPLAARQVVEICRALAADARILLMDEPTSAFQRRDTDRLFALIARLTASGIAVLYISHFLEEVREVAQRYTVLRDGRVVGSGSIADTTNEQLIARMVGRSVAASDHVGRRTPATRGDVVLKVTGLSAPPAVREASFELHVGEILGIFGLIGAGRTQLLRALFGLDRVVSGRIQLCGRMLAVDASSAVRLREGFGYLSEDRTHEGLALPLSIADNITATRLSSCATRLGWLDLRRQAKLTLEWMERLRIRTDARRGERAESAASLPVRDLSGGNQQKVAVGRLLHQHAKVFLLDEPSRGIDVTSKDQVYRVIARSAEEGKAVIVVSSYLPELLGLCDRVAVMHKGRLRAARPVAERTPEEILSEAVGDRATAD